MELKTYAPLLLSIMLGAKPASADVLVNTFADFSNVAQGINGLEYGYYTSPDSSTGAFSTAGMITTLEGWDGSEASGTPELNPNNQHPGVDNFFPAVRRYTIGSAGEPSYTGFVQITGSFGGQIDLGGGPVIGFITVDGTTLFSSPASSGSKVNFDLTVAVSPGSHIDFGVEADGDPTGDRTFYEATVVTVPEPSAAVFIALGIFGMSSRRLRSVNK